MRNRFGGVGKKRESNEESGLIWRMHGKLCGSRGISLTETLVAILLLSLFTMTAASGIGAAVRLHTQSVTFSEAQTLSSTLTQALTDELRYALHIKKVSADSEEPVVEFDSLTYGSGVSVASSGGRILVGGRDLIPDKAYTSGLMAEVVELTYSEEKELFTVKLEIKDQEGSDALVSSKVTVRALNPG